MDDRGQSAVARLTHRIIFNVLLLVVAVWAGVLLAPGNERAHAAGYVTIAMLAGASGNVGTLACYDPDPFTAHPSHAGKPNPWPTCRDTDDSPPDTVTGPHGGINVPVDIGGQNGGATVWVQNGWLPTAIRGGYLYPEDATSECYDPYTAGGRTKVWIYYFDSTGQTDVHSVYYGHIDQNTGILDDWYTWNNFYATSPLWDVWSKDVDFNNQTSGGMSIGSIRNDPSGCVTGEHVHQEMDSSHSESYNTALYSEGCWYTGGTTQDPCEEAGYIFVVGQAITGRSTVTQLLNIYVH